MDNRETEKIRMLHELQSGEFHIEYQNTEIRDEDLLLIIRKGKLFVYPEAELHFPAYGEIKDRLRIPEGKDPFTYLFAIGETRYFTSFFADVSGLAGMLEGLPVYSVRRSYPKDAAFAAAMGNQLIGWYERSFFCGRCGHPTIHAEKERMMYCPECRNMIYPQICPSVIIGVFHEGKLLVSHYNPNHLMINNGSTFKPTVHDTLIAGYVESGETGEQAVRREVMEETGLKVKNIRYLLSAPWPFSSSLLLGYLCEVDGDPTIKVDPEELSDAVFKERWEVERNRENVSLTSWIINEFAAGRLP